MRKKVKRMRHIATSLTNRAVALVFVLSSTLAGCAMNGGGQQASPPSMGDATNVQLSVGFSGGGKPSGPAPGNLIAALKSPNKAGRWQPAIFLYSEQSVTIEAKIGGQAKIVDVDFTDPCCTIAGKKTTSVTITAPAWTPEQKDKRAYRFDLIVNDEVIDPVIIPR